MREFIKKFLRKYLKQYNSASRVLNFIQIMIKINPKNSVIILLVINCIVKKKYMPKSLAACVPEMNLFFSIRPDS